MSHDRTPPAPPPDPHPDPHPDIELLMAYADGELSPDDVARVERLLASDAAARAQLDELRRSAALARQAFEADLAQPVPPALRGAVEQAIAQARSAARRPVEAPEHRDGVASGNGSDQGRVPGRDHDRERGPHQDRSREQQRASGGDRRISRWLAALGLDLRPAGAFAASALLALVGVVAYQLGQSGGESPVAGVQLVSAGEQPALDAALSAARSGERRALPSGAQVELIASFASGGGALCREFRLQRDGGDMLAVACRDEQAWRVSFASIAPAAGGYAPAASPAAAVDAYLASIGAQPLSAEQEAARLR